jgi:hypothetical protein
VRSLPNIVQSLRLQPTLERRPHASLTQSSSFLDLVNTLYTGIDVFCSFGPGLTAAQERGAFDWKLPQATVKQQFGIYVAFHMSKEEIKSMKAPIVYGVILIALGGLLFLTSPSENLRKSLRGARKHGPRIKLTEHPGDYNVKLEHIPFDPVIAEIEQKREDASWEKAHESHLEVGSAYLCLQILDILAMPIFAAVSEV